MPLRERIVDWLARRRFSRRLAKLPLSRFSLSIAHTIEDYEDAFRLVRAAYAHQGILSLRAPELRITAQHVLPEATVLVAREAGVVVGTVTVTADSPAGLPLDENYAEPLGELRQLGARLMEVGSLAVVRCCSGHGLTTLLNMFACWLAENVLHSTHSVIGVNPAAAIWHRAIYGFRPLGYTQRHRTLRAPVGAMVCSFAQLRRHLHRYDAWPLSSGGLLQEHFFESPPACIELPQARTLVDLARWKLPREAFRSLFVDKSDRLQTLDDATREHLQSWRSLTTVCGRELHCAAEGRRLPTRRVASG